MWTMLGYSGQFKDILDNFFLMFPLEGTCTCTLHLTAPHTFTNTVNFNLVLDMKHESCAEENLMH